MTKFQRSLWTIILFLAVLAPFAIVTFLAFRLPRPSPAAIAAATRESATLQPAPVQVVLTRPSTLPAPGPQPEASAQLLAAGDARTLWVVHPVLLTSRDKKYPVYELLQRSSDSGLWAQTRIDGSPYFNGFPDGLAAISPGNSSKSRAAALVFNAGSVNQFSLQTNELEDPLPPGNILLAETGGVRQMFTLAVGPPPASATQPGDRVLPFGPISAEPSTQPLWATTAAPATIPKSATSAPSSPPMLNAYHYMDGSWYLLPPLGQQSVSSDDVPTPHALTAMAALGNRLIIMWVNLGDPSTLYTRALDYANPHSQWSPPVKSHLREPLPAEDDRLLPVTLDGTLYLFWPVITHNSILLRGGWMVTDPSREDDLTLPDKNYLPPMNLGTPPPQEHPADIAIGPAQNSLAAIVTQHDGSLTCQIFSNRGQPLSAASAVQLNTESHDGQVVQNIAMLLLIIMMALALWQWRQRPAILQLPTDAAIASFFLRFMAFVIDFSIPFLVITSIVGMGDSGTYSGIFSTWYASFTNPDELLNSPPLIYILGIYTLHVTIGELFFRRSIGKVLLGLQVLMIDGRSPTVAAVLLRNLVRIVELLSGILLVYIFLSEYRQRLGDLFARTIVVSQKSPETPADPDADESSQSEDEYDRDSSVNRNDER